MATRPKGPVMIMRFAFEAPKLLPSESTYVLEGHLTALERGKSIGQRRWAILQGRTLYLFDSPKNPKLLATAPLAGGSVLEYADKPHTFVITEGNATAHPTDSMLARATPSSSAAPGAGSKSPTAEPTANQGAAGDDLPPTGADVPPSLGARISAKISGGISSIKGTEPSVDPAVKIGSPGKEWVLQADSEPEFNSWMSVLREATSGLPIDEYWARKDALEKDPWKRALDQAARNPHNVWEDPEFPADWSSLGRPIPVVGWLRPSVLVPAPKLVVDGAKPQDVVQGGLGNCWFLGALALVASRPELIGRVISRCNPEAGVYAFRFHLGGTWKEILVDDRIPCIPPGIPMFSWSRDVNELWIPLIEKAYAKAKGSYGALHGGYFVDALADLTGGVPYTMNMADLKEDIASGTLWNRLMTDFQAGSLIGVASIGKKKDIDNGKGILSGHAYAVMEMRTLGSARLVHLRNPWGRTDWIGNWSDTDDERWTDGVKEALGHNPAAGPNGTFWMDFTDFTSVFNRIYMGRILDGSPGVVSRGFKRTVWAGKWTAETSGGCMNFTKTWGTNPQFVLSVPEDDTPLVVQLQQGPGPDGSKELTAIGMVISRGQGTRLAAPYPVKMSESIAARDIAAEVKLAAGLYSVVPYTFKPGVERSFTLSVFTRTNSAMFCTAVDAATRRTGKWISGWGGQKATILPPAQDPLPDTPPPIPKMRITEYGPDDLGDILSDVAGDLREEFPLLSGVDLNTVMHTAASDAKAKHGFV